MVARAKKRSHHKRAKSAKRHPVRRHHRKHGKGLWGDLFSGAKGLARSLAKEVGPKAAAFLADKALHAAANRLDVRHPGFGEVLKGLGKGGLKDAESALYKKYNPPKMAQVLGGMLRSRKRHHKRKRV